MELGQKLLIFDDFFLGQVMTKVSSFYQSIIMMVYGIPFLFEKSISSAASAPGLAGQWSVSEVLLIYSSTVHLFIHLRFIKIPSFFLY